MLKDKMWIVCTCVCTLCLLCLLSNKPGEAGRMPDNKKITYETAYELEVPKTVELLITSKQWLKEWLAEDVFGRLLQ